MPHKEEMSEDELIERIEQFISIYLPKTLYNYYLSNNTGDNNDKKSKKLREKWIY